MAYKGDAKANYPDYSKFGCMVGRHLTFEMYERMFDKVTSNGVTLDKCIQPSCDNMGDILGLIAGDEECYDVFKEIFDCCLNERHKGFGPDEKHVASDLDVNKLVGGMFDEKYVKSCRIRTGRGIRGFCFPPSINRGSRRKVESIITSALAGLKGDLTGTYYPLSKMTPEQENQLIEDHFLFQKPTGHLLVNSGSVRDWPDARGIWHNDEKTFLIWVNEEDHMRVISMQKGGDIRATFERFSRGLDVIAGLMKTSGYEYMSHDRLGNLCACPTNVGSALRASVHIQLHQLAKHAQFEDIIKAMDLDKRGTSGEHTESADDVFDLSNKARLKKSEVQFVQLLIDSVDTLVKMEKRLEAGESIDDLLPAGCVKK